MSHSVLPAPLACQFVVLVAISLVDAGDLGDQGVVRVRVTKQGADGQQDLRYRQGRRPLRPQNVQADRPVGVYIRVVDPSRERHFRGLERIVRGEVDGEEEHPSLVGAVRGTHDGRLPVK